MLCGDIHCRGYNTICMYSPRRVDSKVWKGRKKLPRLWGHALYRGPQLGPSKAHHHLPWTTESHGNPKLHGRQGECSHPHTDAESHSNPGSHRTKDKILEGRVLPSHHLPCHFHHPLRLLRALIQQKFVNLRSRFRHFLLFPPHRNHRVSSTVCLPDRYMSTSAITDSPDVSC